MFLARILFLLSFLTATFSYKFLVFNPLFAHSHTNFLSKIADTLTEANHDVTVLLPIVDADLANKSGLELTKKAIYVEQSPLLYSHLMEKENSMRKNLWNIETGPWNMFQILILAAKVVEISCKHTFKQHEIIEQLRKEKFDAAIVEPFTICGYAYAEELGIPTTIGALSVVHKEFISSFLGEPLIPSYVPTINVPYTDRMTFSHRLRNSLSVYLGIYAHRYLFKGEEDFLTERQGDRFPGSEELIARSPVFFTNSNPYLNYPKPKIHKVVEIGGIVVDTKKGHKLEKKWDDVLNERSHTVYISFGSVAESRNMPQEYKESILAVCESLPNVTFIWKYEEPTTIADHLSNLYLEPWLPQNALLSDRRLSLFITHGGLGSTTEVAYFGRPSIMIPLFSEQPRNAKMLARHGGAFILERKDLGDQDKLKSAITEAITNSSYAEAATRLAEMLNGAPFSPKELVVKHSEFATKFGRMPSLDPYGRKLSTIAYYNLDVFAFLLVFFFTLFVILFLAFRWVYSRIFRLKKPKSE